MTKKRCPAAAAPRDPRSGLIAALEKLPGAETKRRHLDNLALQLEITAAIMGVADLPRAKSAGSKATKAELGKYARLANGLRNHILSMHREALAELEASGAREWLLIIDDLAQTSVAAAQGLNRESNNEPGPRGRPRKNQAADVARMAARAYRIITGEDATVGTNPGDGKAYGAFLDFTSAVFKALSIDAKPEHHAREASKEKNTGPAAQ